MAMEMNSRDLPPSRHSSPAVLYYSSEASSRSGCKEPLVRRWHSESEEKKINIFPWSAAICCVLIAIDILVCLPVFLTMSVAEPVAQYDSSMSWHARSAMLLIVQSMVLEICILISSYTAVGIAGDDLKPQGDFKSKAAAGSEKLANRMDLAEHNFGDSCITLLEYIVKFVTALHFMYPEGIVAYKVALRSDADRLVYPMRHLQWSIGVPFLVLLSNRAFLAGRFSQVQVVLRSLPVCLLTTMYCVTAYVMEVTTSIAARNLLIGLTMISFIWATVDQLQLVQCIDGVTAKRLKVAMLGYQILTFAAYSVVYFVAYFGYIGHQTEQSIYNYMDATVKVLHGCFLAMIRNYEDIRIIKLWWTESLAARRDFERLVKQARVPIFTLDLKGRVTSWNASLAQLTDLPVEAVEGVEVSKLLKKDCREGFQQAVAKASMAVPPASNALEIAFRKNPLADEDNEKSSENVTVGGRPKQPSQCVVMVMSVVKKTARDGAIEGYVGIGQDITEICELKAVEQKKVQLMAVVSHELRSPLHGMIGLTNMMEQTTPNHNFKQQLGMVRCCANRLLDLVTNIMEITESEQRQRKGLGARDKQSVVNFMEVAEEVTVMTMMATDKAGKPLVSSEVELRNLLPELEPFPVVLGNPYKCTQLLYNLVTNACKFTKQGSVTLRAKHSKESSALEISVVDTGAGISPEALDRIFQPFEQDHGSTADSRSFQGMGLGLAVCKETVRLHKGTIGVESKLDVGSTFTVSLPCEDSYIEKKGEADSISKTLANQLKSQAAQEPKTAPEEVPRQVKAQLQPKPAHTLVANDDHRHLKTADEKLLEDGAPRPRPIVLSVDDDEINQEVVKNSLSTDCDIQPAMDGTEALNYLGACIKESKRLPDVILLDIQMPGLTGFDVLAEIRKNYSKAHTKLPVIMVSAKAPSELVALRSYTDGCSDYLVKPFHTDLLKAKVNVALQIKEEIQDYCKAASILSETARIANDTAKAAASQWEDRAKAAQATLDQTKKRLDEAEQKASAATTEAAQAQEHAKAMSDRAKGVEQELAELRKELESRRLADASAASNSASTAAPSLPADTSPEVSPGTSTAQWPRREPMQPMMPSVAMPQASPRMATHQASPRMPPTTPRMAIPQATPRTAVPSTTPRSLASGGGDIRGGLVPWLYEQLADREAEIAKLNGRLAADAGSKQLASRHIDAVIEAAAHSRSLLDAVERQSRREAAGLRDQSASQA